MSTQELAKSEREFAALDAAYNSVASYIKHIAGGKIRSLIVNGPPGVGKSFMVKQFLEKHSENDHKSVTGHITLLSLYHALYSHRQSKQVLVLDDTDSVFKQIEGLNLLKAAMDTQATRSVHWESSKPLPQGVPPSFEFNGGVVLITNVGFGGNGSKLSVHLNALKDRSYCVQVGSDSRETCYSMISYMVNRQDMLAQYALSSDEKNMLLGYLHAKLQTLATVVTTNNYQAGRPL